ncbi:MAG: 4Fe-4S dicluster domain-containing protein [Siphonobacter sp.]
MVEESYWGTIKRGIRTSLKGLQISFRHLKDSRRRRKPIYVDDPSYFEQKTGMVTLRYPYEAIPVPDNGRYRLHNEMDDCIVCDKCAKICPVDCIEIEPIKATGEIAKASDGSSIRLYAATFDIDMAKCCYCGLCTTVCPTECLTMTKTYDYSEFDIRDMLYHFTNLTPQQAQEKKDLYDQFMAEKEAAKLKKEPVKTEEAKPEAARPAFKPSFRKAEEPTADSSEEAKPARPVFKPGLKKPAESIQSEENKEESKPAARPVFKPGFKKTVEETNSEEPKPAERPSFKPGLKQPNPELNEADKQNETLEMASDQAAEPVRKNFKPVFKKKEETEATLSAPDFSESSGEVEPPARSSFKPVFKKSTPPKEVIPASSETEHSEGVSSLPEKSTQEEIETSKPKGKSFKPVFKKPKPPEE